MKSITYDNAARILADLVAIPSVNPMGRPWEAKRPVERGITEYLEGLFSSYDVERTRQSCSPIHENLLITMGGRENGPWTLFESHADTVPADDWLEKAFTPRIIDQRLYGRGACDDKGCLTSMTLALLDLLESRQQPRYPIAFLVAGDEEYAQTGIKHFVSAAHPIGRGVFGEPTSLVPVIQHKGTIRWDVIVQGRSAHTSRPELGVNAILLMTEVIKAVQQYEAELQKVHRNPLLTGPTLTVTMINGGRTRNAVPDQCTVAIDFRVLPGMEAAEERDKLIRFLDGLGRPISHGPVQITTPPLNTLPDDPFSQRVLQACRKEGKPEIEFVGAPYGTDAAWMNGNAPAVVLGPGSIASAHAVDENIELSEVVECARIYREIMLEPSLQ